VRDDEAPLTAAIIQLASAYGRYGYRRVTALPQDGGKSRSAPSGSRSQRSVELGSLDFVHDQLSNGQSFRALTIIDIYSREALAIEVGQRLRGETYGGGTQSPGPAARCATLPVCGQRRGITGQLVDLWAYHHAVRIDFSRRGKPTGNAFIETFNGTLRDECLNLQLVR
jgi:putative transposase